MAFALFTPLFAKIDAVSQTFVADISTKVIAQMTPFLTIGLTLSFMFTALLIARGVIDRPIMDFLGRSITIAIITSIALAGGLYQTQIADVITSAPDDLASALITSPTQGSAAAQLIDKAASEGFDKAGAAWEQGSIISTSGLMYCVFGLIIFLSTAVLVAVGGAFILMAKLGLALLAGVGPFFVFSLLFKATARLFESWIGQVFNYAMLIVLFSAVFGLCMSIFTGYVSDVQFDGVQNVAYTLGGLVILVVAMALVLLQLPKIAGALAGGVSLGFLHEAKALRSGAQSAASAGGSAAGSLYTRGQKDPSGARGPATGAIPAAARAAGKAAGFFKGNKAA